MKSNNETNRQNPAYTLKSACVGFCQKMLKRLQRAKESVVAEYHELLAGHEHAVHLALNEAEALAWETGYPELFFPTLATEKVAALANWRRHQQAVRVWSPSSVRLLGNRPETGNNTEMAFPA